MATIRYEWLPRQGPRYVVYLDGEAAVQCRTLAEALQVGAMVVVGQRLRKDEERNAQQ
jgi:hypothetical protein